MPDRYPHHPHVQRLQYLWPPKPRMSALCVRLIDRISTRYSIVNADGNPVVPGSALVDVVRDECLQLSAEDIGKLQLLLCL